MKRLILLTLSLLHVIMSCYQKIAVFIDRKGVKKMQNLVVGWKGFLDGLDRCDDDFDYTQWGPELSVLDPYDVGILWTVFRECEILKVNPCTVSLITSGTKTDRWIKGNSAKMAALPAIFKELEERKIVPTSGTLAIVEEVDGVSTIVYSVFAPTCLHGSVYELPPVKLKPTKYAVVVSEAD